MKKEIKTTTEINKTWEGLPGFMLIFPVTIALSGEMASERESLLALSKDERASKLLDFRLRLLGDVLTAPPYVLNVENINKAIEEKQTRLAKEYQDKGATEEEAKAQAQKHLLTQEELEPLKESFPNWELYAQDGLTLRDIVTAYFGQTDKDGRQIFSGLIEGITVDYWEWANPRPIFSVSAFLQN